MNLNDVLIDMGLVDAFDGIKADFVDMAEISPNNNIRISRVLQDVKVKVMEKGTEAAAVTMVEMRAECALEEFAEQISLYLDSPYVYMVMDLETLAPLFAGVMEDPSLEE